MQRLVYVFAAPGLHSQVYEQCDIMDSMCYTQLEVSKQQEFPVSERSQEKCYFS